MPEEEKIGTGYRILKGLLPGQNPKSIRERCLTIEEVSKLLDTIRGSGHKFWKRDHCAVFCGFHFALRVAEAVLLERDTFRYISSGECRIRRLKSLPRVRCTCLSCSRRFRVSCKKIGQEHTCTCGKKVLVPTPEKPVDTNPPEKVPPVVETHVMEYLQKYMSQVMKPAQRWLFEGQHSPEDVQEVIPHMSQVHLEKIFGHWVVEAGLPKIYSWHSLRHARAVFIWDRFEDAVMVRDMLGQSSLGSTEKYLQMSQARKKKLQEALEGFKIGV